MTNRTEKFVRILSFTLIATMLWLSAFCMLSYASSQQTSSTTASTIIDNAESIVNDSDNDIVSAAEMLVWLNDGMIDIASRSHCLETTESVTLLASTIEYTITSTYTTVKAVQYVDASGNTYALKKGSPGSVGQNTAITQPTYWYDWGGKIGVYPALSSVTTETVTLYLITRPTAITSGDNVTTPALYDTALTYYVAAHAFLKDRQTGRYAQLMSMYLQEMAQIRADLNEYPRGNIE